MNIHLRFGLQKDKEIIRDLSDKLDGLVIPAHILSYQSAVISAFVSSFTDMPFIIDPMTYLLQHPKVELTNGSGDLRKSISKMCAEYTPDVESVLLAHRQLSPNNIPDCEILCKGVRNQQLSISSKAATKKAEKYLKRYGRGDSVTPRFIVSPYFHFNSTSDQWYKLSLEMAQAMQTICSEKGDGIEAGVVIFVPADKLTDDEIATIASDYSKFKHIILWPGDFDERTANKAQIVNIRKLVSKLSEFAEVEILYAGFLLMTTAADGAKVVSHGLTYSQHKSFAVTPGGGGMPERYYIPKFRAFRSLSQTDIIFHQKPELMCDCPVCENLLQSNPDRIILFSDEPEKLREHFISVRKQEAIEMDNFDRSSLVSELRDIYHEYHSSICNLPNPDALVSGSNMNGLEYLNRWADGISEEL